MSGIQKAKTMNPLIQKQIDEDIEQIFQAAVIYYQFEQSLKKIIESKENKENEKIYMISKQFVDNFKEITDYDKSKELYAKNDEKNFEEVKNKLSGRTLDDLELVILGDLKLYNDCENIESDCENGFEFVNYEFLDKLDVFDADDMTEKKDSNIDLYKENNFTSIIFPDKAKLLISEQNGKKKYHAIPPPISEAKDQITLKKTKTFSITNRKRTVK